MKRFTLPMILCTLSALSGCKAIDESGRQGLFESHGLLEQIADSRCTSCQPGSPCGKCAQGTPLTSHKGGKSHQGGGKLHKGCKNARSGDPYCVHEGCPTCGPLRRKLGMDGFGVHHVASTAAAGAAGAVGRGVEFVSLFGGNAAAGMWANYQYRRAQGLGRVQNGYLDNPYAQGPPSGTYGYPYYTIRSPRDFLLDNPPTIGY